MLIYRTSAALLKNGFRSKFTQFRAGVTTTNLTDRSTVNLEHLKSNPEISVITLKRTKQKNALCRELVNDLNAALTDVSASNSTRVLIIKSSVPGVFCAGADLKERLTMPQKEVSQFTNGLRSLMARIFYFKIPVIAAIDGLALGGGLELALACDIRVSSAVAKLGLVETRLAIMPGAGGTVFLPRLINPAVAKEMIFTAKIVDGQEAKELGLVNHAVQQNEEGNAAYQKAVTIGCDIIPNGPVGIEMAKISLNRGFETDIGNAMAIEQACYAQIIPTKDRIEGLKAFVEKRQPKYLGE